MIKIIHRVNSIKKLKQVDTSFGVEIDIRSFGDRLILNHEPFENGELFSEWLKFYNHKFLILNTKEEGLEEIILVELGEKGINNFFFLDLSFPFLIKLANEGEKRCAVRLSEFEDIKTVINLSGLVSWVWVDCFTKFPMTRLELDLLKETHGFNLCIVSPELQGRGSETSIKKFVNDINMLNLNIDAVCTKYPELW